MRGEDVRAVTMGRHCALTTNGLQTTGPTSLNASQHGHPLTTDGPDGDPSHVDHDEAIPPFFISDIARYAYGAKSINGDL